MRFAGDFASRDHDVLIEGLRLSSEFALSAQLASAHKLHIIALSTPMEDCVRNLLLRRRAAKSSFEAIARKTAGEQRRVKHACDHLQDRAMIEVLDFDRALARTRELLCLTTSRSRPDASQIRSTCLL